MERRRVAVTGLGMVTPLGVDLGVFWKRSVEGYSGAGEIRQFDATGYTCRIAAEVIEFDVNAFIPIKEQKRMDRYSHYALGAAKMAVKDSGLNPASGNADRMGVYVGSGIGGLQTLETQHSILLNKGPTRCSPFMIPEMISNMAAGLIAIEHNLRGPNMAVISACATAAHSIGMALRSIQCGDADVMLAGGSEATVCPLGIAGFASMRALSTRNDDPKKASRPFDRDRDGFVMGEGAAVLVLEEWEHARHRGAQIYAELAGLGMTCDAYHMTAPCDDGEGAARAMKNALADAGMNADAIDYVNAHGTSTPLNDKAETLAIKRAFGEENARKLMIGSTKSMTGHLLGAAGAVESAICALALRHGIVPPTINYETPDPDCDLDYVPNTARQKPIRACLNNSLGFGGHNASLLFTAV